MIFALLLLASPAAAESKSTSLTVTAFVLPRCSVGTTEGARCVIAAPPRVERVAGRVRYVF